MAARQRIHSILCSKQVKTTLLFVFLAAPFGPTSVVSVSLALVAFVSLVFWMMQSSEKTVRVPQELSLYLKYTSILTLAITVTVLINGMFPYQIGSVVIKPNLIGALQKYLHLLRPIFITYLCWNYFKTSNEELIKVFIYRIYPVFLMINFFQIGFGWPHTIQSHMLIPGAPFRSQGFYGSYLTYAAALGFPLYMALEEAIKRRTVASISIASLGTLAMIACSSRTAWVALGLGIVCLAFTATPKQYRKLAGTLITAIVIGVLVSPKVRSRIFSSHINDRALLWKINFEVFKENPVTGVGFLSSGEATAAYKSTFIPDHPDQFVSHAHNNFIEMLSTTGLLGTGVWVAWNMWLLLICWRRRTYGVLAGLITFHFNGLTQVNFWEPRGLSMFMTVIGFFLFVQNRTQTTQNS